jgi:ketol-acid reductoisomerase
MGAIRKILPLLSLASVTNGSNLLEGLFLAQYQVLRKNGHTPSEAFNETVEEATQSLYPLIGQKG